MALVGVELAAARRPIPSRASALRFSTLEDHDWRWSVDANKRRSEASRQPNSLFIGRHPRTLFSTRDICAHRQRTFVLHCFRFWFLLASGPPAPHFLLKCHYPTLQMFLRTCADCFVQIDQHLPDASHPGVPSRYLGILVHHVLHVCSGLLQRGHSPDRNHGIRKPTFRRLFQCRVSMASAMPWPPPMHSVTMPRLRPSRRIEWISLVVSTAPVAPIG